MKTHFIIAAMMLVIGCISITPASATKKTILMNAAKLKTYKHYQIYKSDNLELGDYIEVNKGFTNELLLKAPIANQGELPSNAKIRITVGTNPLAQDADPSIGIYDEKRINRIHIINDGRNITANPCVLKYAIEQDGRSEYLGDVVPGTYTLLFDPANDFGACSTNAGFETSGKFKWHVNPSNGLKLLLMRDGGGETYFFHYFLIEVFY